MPKSAAAANVAWHNPADSRQEPKTDNAHTTSFACGPARHSTQAPRWAQPTAGTAGGVWRVDRIRRRLCRLRTVAALARQPRRTRCADCTDRRFGHRVQHRAGSDPHERPATSRRARTRRPLLSVAEPDAAGPRDQADGRRADRSERAPVRHDCVRRHHPAPDGACANHLSALSGGRAGCRSARSHVSRLPQRHALSGRRSRLRVRARPSISSRAARERASQIRAPACWKGASATPTSPYAFRATGWTNGQTSPAESIA